MVLHSNKKIMITQKFAIPFFKFNLSDWKNKKDNILNNLPNYRNYSDTFKSLNHYSDYFENLDKSPNYANEIVASISEEITKFCDETKLNWRMTNLWFQTYEKYNNFSLHNYGHEGWSGILFVEYDKEKHGSVNYYSPYQSWERDRLGAYESYSPEVSEGNIIIFPSSIQHEICMNFSDTNSILISFILK